MVFECDASLLPFRMNDDVRFSTELETDDGID